MKILVIPTTDWIRHPFPNRLNFIFDILSERHDIYVLHFQLLRFRDNEPRSTSCRLIPAGCIDLEDPSLYYISNSFIHLLKIRQVVKEEGIDVILSANVIPSFMANLVGVPIVFDYLDHLEESASIYYPNSLLGRLVKGVVGRISRYNLHHATLVITLTQELKGYLGGIGVDRVRIIPNGVDTSLLLPLPKDRAKRDLGLEGPVLGYVGSLEYWVDLEMVVQALTRLDVVLLVVGPSLFTDYEERIKEMAEDLGVLDRIVFTGAVPYADLGRYISAMDIGLNPLKMMIKNEYVVGGKVFNYLSCGRPVLSSRMVSLERLLGDGLYYYDDLDDFVSQVNRILRSPPPVDEERSLAKKFDWRDLAGQYEKVLRSAV
ncbi:MAG: glycosyltransferase [Methanotrichaceae archaeon]|nr:glycosyltransferase [Methanotrichaceae archaeon]